ADEAVLSAVVLHAGAQGRARGDGGGGASQPEGVGRARLQVQCRWVRAAAGVRSEDAAGVQLEGGGSGEWRQRRRHRGRLGRWLRDREGRRLGRGFGRHEEALTVHSEQGGNWPFPSTTPPSVKGIPSSSSTWPKTSVTRK